MTDLDKETEELFAAARQASDATPVDEVRIRRALALRMGAAAVTLTAAARAGGGASSASAGSPLGLKAFTLGLAAKGTPLALVAVVGMAAIWGGRHGRDVAPAPYAATTREPAVFAPEIAPVDPAQGTREVEERALMPERTAPPPPAVGVAAHTVTLRSSAAEGVSSRVRSDDEAVAAPAGSTASALSDEIALVAHMHEAWRAGDVSALDRSIAEHERRFPDGILAEEREAMRTMQACRRAGATRAGQFAREFALRHPGSPHLGRVGAVCAEKKP
jgi:hypothetical protein